MGTDMAAAQTANSTPVQLAAPPAPRVPSQQSIITTLMRELVQTNDNRYYLQALAAEQEVELGAQAARIAELEAELAGMRPEVKGPGAGDG